MSGWIPIGDGGIDRERIISAENFDAGDSYTYTVGDTASEVLFILRGGAGGTNEGTYSGAPGYGGEISGVVDATDLPSDLEVYVGEQGGTPDGGFNGGAVGRDGENDKYVSSGGGGGATDIRTSSSLDDRILVAGGGGGASEVENLDRYTDFFDGGDGGAEEGGTGSDHETAGGGGTQNEGGEAGEGGSEDGEFGEGGEGIQDRNTNGYGMAGGGGGGWYGGGGGGIVSFDHYAGGGGGGSNYHEEYVNELENLRGTNDDDGIAIIIELDD